MVLHDLLNIHILWFFSLVLRCCHCLDFRDGRVKRRSMSE